MINLSKRSIELFCFALRPLLPLLVDSWFAFGSASSSRAVGYHRNVAFSLREEELDTEWEVNQLWSERVRDGGESVRAREREIDRAKLETQRRVRSDC